MAAENNDNCSEKKAKIDKFCVDPDQLAIFAALTAITITHNMTSKEIDTLINYTSLLTKNLLSIAAQKSINKRADVIDLSDIV